MLGSNNSIYSRRLVTTSGQKLYGSTNILTGEPCYIESMDAQIAAILDNQNAFFTYQIFFEGKPDIIIGDKLVDEQANEYVVSGINKNHNNTDTSDLTEVIAVKVYQ